MLLDVLSPAPVRTGHLRASDNAAGSAARGVFFLVAVAQAAVFGLSGLFGGFYDFSAWGALALISSVLLVALVLVQPLALSRPAALALAGVALLTAWSALSMTWAESVDQAWNEVNRFGFYAITLALVIGAVRTRRHAATVMGVLTAGMAVTVLYTVGAMLLGGGGSMFKDFRLEDPLGYVNGMAGLALMAFWAFIALAEGARHPAGRGCAMAFAVLAGDLIVLTQSRAAVPAVVASGLLMLAVVPGRMTRAWALLAACAGVAVSLPVVLDVYGEFSEQALYPADGTVRSAAAAACVAAIAAGVVWALACAAAPATASQSLRRVSAGALAAIVLAGAVTAVVAVGDPIDRVKTEYDDFVSLRVDEDRATRFTEGGGFRYDLWRVAFDEFKGSPLRGVGAGNYDTDYYRERRNPQPAPQPHSLEMQLLGELGVVGLAALLLLVAGVVWGMVRAAREPLERDRWIVVGAAGIFLAWLAHTSVDWLHNIPGLTGIALVAAGVVLAVRRPDEERGALASRRVSVAVIGLVVVLALLAASEGRRWAGEYYLARSGSELNRDADAALRDAGRALDLNPDSLPAHYAAARAYAAMDRYELARAALLDAARQEPSDYVPWVLLGDLAVRHGRLGQARVAYRRATVRSPYDTDFSVSNSLEELRGKLMAPGSAEQAEMPVAVEPAEAGHHLLVPRVAPERVEVRSPSWPYSAATNLLLSALLVGTLYLPVFLAQPPAALAAVLVVPAVFAALLARVVFESNAALATRRGDAAGQLKAALLPALLGVAVVALTGVLADAEISLAGVAASVPMAVAVLTVAARLRGLELRVRAGARRVYFVGSPEQRAELAVEARRRGDMQLVGHLDLDSGAARPTNGDLMDEMLRSGATVVVLASAAIHDEDVVAVASELNVRGRRIRVLSHFYEEEFAKVPLMELNAAWFLFDVAEIHSPRAYGVVKRAAETLFAAALLLLAAPLVPVIAIAIKLSGIGPVLFRQERVGKDGQRFRLTKFRTMRQDPAGREPVPPVGRILRRFRFDELPQLWDVVRGKLSLVGPRPEQPLIVERLQESIEFYAFRHRVRPGLTGWAQVNHVDEMPEKLQYDFYYVKNQGLLLDLMIIAWTVRTILSGAGR